MSHPSRRELRLIAGPLTAEAFAPFGTVFEAPNVPSRMDLGACLDNQRGAAASPELLLVRIEPASLPLQAELMERHPHSSQTFVPVNVARYVVVVAPRGRAGRPDMDAARAFIADGGQGVTYRANTWHHGVTVLDRDGIFAVLTFNDGTDRDTEFFTLSQPRTVAEG